MDRQFPNGDFMEAILNSSFDWNGIREAFVFATENDTERRHHALRPPAHRHGADFRRRAHLLEPRGGEARDRPKLTGKASGIIHLINSGAATLDATGRMTRDGKPVMKPFWEVTPEDAGACLEATQGPPASLDSFRGGGYSSQFLTCGEFPVTMARLNWIAGQNNQ